MPTFRPEYPRPQMVRKDWVNLNGEWQFDFDFGKSGRERGLQNLRKLSRKINVPFCPESRLSGINYKDFMSAVWYMRPFVLPESWKNKRILIHFGAVDYKSEVWINGKSVGHHIGGYSSFSFEITKELKNGENVITVCAEDDVRSGLQPRGKQSFRYDSFGCMYTRTTGIWQTVWLEAVPKSYISDLRITPDLENGRAQLVATIDGEPNGLKLSAEAFLEGTSVGADCVKIGGGLAQLTIKIDEDKIREWQPGSPILYGLNLKLSDKNVVLDEVDSYFGLRSLGWKFPALLLNGRPLFQRLVLDQGFYPDGIYTAPSDDDLRMDIERSMAMGFNGARLHQKVFEERFLYWADKLGYIVWGETGNWGTKESLAEARENFMSEWMEIIKRDYNHPSIVGWCPFNETYPNFNVDLMLGVVHMTKQFDPTRPVIDSSGYVHTCAADVFDSHDYDQNPETFAERHSHFISDNSPFIVHPDADAPYMGQPYFVSEFGGIWWNPDHEDEASWGYGDRPKSKKEFIERYKGLTETLLNHPKMCGFCYTQLTDVEQEVNGLYTYNRKAKFDPAKIKKITAQPAAIERDPAN